ncbi:hypothetical protein CYMTET_20361 [Cymbomonas tetramitiformis]|uniref:Right handed beta helix domain-containing protein n=1 Tax=Cymbomonas tetramitiformis TaxID=36881 RepID=A0AAE0L4A8_9CHLO|nr:hypothetical protein CYMTET_20361 [Cymbomonas tetramitiformis]
MSQITMRGGVVHIQADAHSEDGNEVQVVVNNSDITQNTAMASGGVFSTQNMYANVTMDRCTILHNAATKEGGVLHLDFSRLMIVMSLCVISHNKATGMGGGVVYADIMQTANFTLSLCNVSHNDAENGNGGVMNVYHPQYQQDDKRSHVTMEGCSIFQNKAAEGGVLYVWMGYRSRGQSIVSFSGSALSQNSAEAGGVVSIDAKNTASARGRVIMEHCVVSQNRAENVEYTREDGGRGGAVAVEISDLSSHDDVHFDVIMTDCNLLQNYAEV